jgi:hypothetical protein
VNLRVESRWEVLELVSSWKCHPVDCGLLVSLCALRRWQLPVECVCVPSRMRVDVYRRRNLWTDVESQLTVLFKID